MQIGTLFDLFTDGQDLVEFFEGVETTEQLVSRLEVLKRKDTEQLLHCIVGMRSSLNQLYKATFEMSATIADGEIEDLGEDDDDGSVDKTLEELAAEFPDAPAATDTENPISNPEAPPADPKTVETPNS